MNILCIDNKSIGAPNIIWAMRENGWTVEVLQEDIDGKRRIPELEEKLTQYFQKKEYDFLFTFNYLPVIAEACHKNQVRYVSWVYDSPLVALYSYTMIYDTNYVFLFDYEQYRELRGMGLTRVFYLPLASNTLWRFPQEKQKQYEPMQITFVGSLYNETKNSLYKKFEGISSFAMGYLDALIEAQKKVYGSYILQEGLTVEILSECQKVCPYDENNKNGVETARYIYADYFLSRRVTSLERLEALERLSQKHETYLFSGSGKNQLSKVHHMGKVDYYYDMPDVFKNSAINLNMTLKSIKSGIPVRVLDIMGTGSFVLTNYQLEMEEYFRAGVHYDYYSSIEELEDKADYYLKHAAIREKMAQEGYKRVRDEFNYPKRLREITETLRQF